jgi:hypothetical protein
MDEISILKEIKEGKELNNFTNDEITPYMVLAAVTYHENGYKEIPDGKWNKRAARIAVMHNFTAMTYIPEAYKIVCHREFAMAANKLSKNTLDSYSEIFNSQDDAFIKHVINDNPGARRFLLPQAAKNIPHSSGPSVKAAQNDSSSAKNVSLDNICSMSPLNAYNFTDDPEISSPDENGPERYLALPIQDQTEERLDYLLDQDDLFPDNFIKRFTISNRNEAHYEKKGNTVQAQYWKDKVNPIVTRQMIEKIASMHPEAAICTPGYLSKEPVINFWNKKRSVLPKDLLQRYFMKFPEKVIDISMANDITITWEALAHAPSIFLNSDYAKRYISRNPADILRLPECYQNEKNIISDGVPIKTGTLPLIKNEDLRNKVAIALNIQQTK